MHYHDASRNESVIYGVILEMYLVGMVIYKPSNKVVKKNIMVTLYIDI